RARRQQVPGSALSFFAAGDHLAAWHADAVFGEDGFGLVFVDFHAAERTEQEMRQAASLRNESAELQTFDCIRQLGCATNIERSFAPSELVVSHSAPHGLRSGLPI